jgi:hypothetical protein
MALATLSQGPVKFTFAIPGFAVTLQQEIHSRRPRKFRHSPHVLLHEHCSTTRRELFVARASSYDAALCLPQ